MCMETAAMHQKTSGDWSISGQGYSAESIKWVHYSMQHATTLKTTDYLEKLSDDIN